MKRLGQILLEHGWIAPVQLTRALAHQRSFGGRLGTCLLELGELEERLLLRALSLQLGVPAADAEDLRSVPEEVVKLLPARIARRGQAIPFRAYGGQLSVALLAITDLALQDELAFVSGKRLKVHIANEARIFEGLEKYYGEECPRRFSQLADRLNRSRYLWQAEAAEAALASPAASPARGATPASLASPVAVVAPPPMTLSAPPPLPPPPASPPAPTTVAPPPEIPVKDPEPKPLAPLARQAPVAPPEPANTGPLSLVEARERLREPSDRDEVGSAVLSFFASRFSRVVLLGLRKEEVTGWMGRGEKLDSQQLRRFCADAVAPTLFATLRAGAPLFRGALPALRAHQELAACWGGGLPHDCLILPLEVKGRAVALVYADREPQGLEGVDFAELRDFLGFASAALEMCIVRQKMRRRES